MTAIILLTVLQAVVQALGWTWIHDREHDREQLGAAITMKALSIRQPWAWLILRPDLRPAERDRLRVDGLLKDIENRSRPNRKGIISLSPLRCEVRCEG